MEGMIKQQDRVSGYIIRSIENLKRMGQANITVGTVEAKIETINKQWDEFSERHEDIEDSATEEDKKRLYFVQKVYETTEDAYFLNKGKYLDLLRELKGDAAPPPPKSATAAQQLPKLNLPRFAGDFTEWPAFRDLFTSMVRTSTSLTPIEKLHYLKMSLTKELQRCLRRYRCLRRISNRPGRP